MANVFSRIGDFLGKASRSKGNGSSSRLPLPRAGGGMGGAVYTGSRFEFADYLTVGGRPLPIQPKDAGDLLLNPIVAICLGWIGTSWPLAIPQVGRLSGAEFVPDRRRHPLLELLQRPNPAYGGKWLFWALNCDYWTRGNAYAQLVTVGGKPAELNYLPARLICPKPDSKGYLDHYEYSPEGKPIPVSPEELVHFRYGINPENPLEGLAPLTSAFREVVTDNASSDYSAGLFKEGGIPPAILTPRVSKDALNEPVLSADEARELTEQLQERMRLNPGQVRFITAAMELLQLSFKPGEMGLNEVREMPETRIPALFQIPPQVLNLRAGMEHQTYNNLETAVAQAWHACLIPLQDYFAEELTNKVLPLYPGSEGKVLRYDRSKIGELQPDQAVEREVGLKELEAGAITLEEYRALAGRQTDDETRAALKLEREERMPPAPKPAPGANDSDKR